MSSEARLIIAASETDANLYYATRFLAPDPFVFLQVEGRKILLMSDLEVDRARAQARVDEVLSLTEYEEKARQRWQPPHLWRQAGLGTSPVPPRCPSSSCSSHRPAPERCARANKRRGSSRSGGSP